MCAALSVHHHPLFIEIIFVPHDTLHANSLASPRICHLISLFPVCCSLLENISTLDRSLISRPVILPQMLANACKSNENKREKKTRKTLAGPRPGNTTNWPPMQPQRQCPRQSRPRKITHDGTGVFILWATLCKLTQRAVCRVEGWGDMNTKRRRKISGNAGASRRPKSNQTFFFRRLAQ